MNDPDAKLDGGDVLWTGREILVGLSSRTNDKGVQAVQEAFPGYPVTGIEVAGPLHLKTLLTLCGQDTLCASLESGDSYKMLEVLTISFRKKSFPKAPHMLSIRELMKRPSLPTRGFWFLTICQPICYASMATLCANPPPKRPNLTKFCNSKWAPSTKSSAWN